MYDHLAITFDSCRQTGTTHLRSGEACQDVILTENDAHCVIFGLADGRSGAAMSARGGQVILKHIAAFIQRKGIENLASYRYQDELTYEIMRLIRERIDTLSQKSNFAADEFASTLVMLAIDKATGTYITIHLGDGIILGIRDNDSTIPISVPDNGITAKYTWLTTSPSALNHLRIRFGNINGYRRVLMMTDGASDLCYGRNIRPAARTLFQTADQTQIINRLMSVPHTDDASLIISDIISPYQI